MKKLIILLVLTVLMVSVVSSEQKIDKDNKKPSKVSELEEKQITKENKTKILDSYGKKFPKLKKIETYYQNGNITIIKVKIKRGKGQEQARIITRTNEFLEVQK